MLATLYNAGRPGGSSPRSGSSFGLVEAGATEHGTNSFGLDQIVDGVILCLDNVSMGKWDCCGAQGAGKMADAALDHYRRIDTCEI